MAECGGLENRCRVTPDRGFESLALRAVNTDRAIDALLAKLRRDFAIPERAEVHIPAMPANEWDRPPSPAKESSSGLLTPAP